LLRDDLDEALHIIAPSYLLHLAWFTEPGCFWDAPENLDWVAASLRLVRAFGKRGGERLVVAGTCAEYDWRNELLDEFSTPLKPATLYGAAKAALFNIVERAAGPLDISLAWGRIFFPYGPREQPGRLISGILDGIAAGRSVPCSEGTQVRDFMHVEDVGNALVTLLDSPVGGPVNIASGVGVTVRNVVEQIAFLAHGGNLVEFGGRPMQAGEPPLMNAAVDRLRNELAFTPRFGLEDGLADTVARRTGSRQKSS
jgi:nucleoside-diphosphate-sugar epimerase